MRGYEGWSLDTGVVATCPDCSDDVGRTSDLAELVELIDSHAQECAITIATEE